MEGLLRGIAGLLTVEHIVSDPEMVSCLPALAAGEWVLFAFGTPLDLS